MYLPLPLLKARYGNNFRSYIVNVLDHNLNSGNDQFSMLFAYGSRKAHLWFEKESRNVYVQTFNNCQSHPFISFRFFNLLLL